MQNKDKEIIEIIQAIKNQFKDSDVVNIVFDDTSSTDVIKVYSEHWLGKIRTLNSQLSYSVYQKIEIQLNQNIHIKVIRYLVFNSNFIEIETFYDTPICDLNKLFDLQSFCFKGFLKKTKNVVSLIDASFRGVENELENINDWYTDWCASPKNNSNVSLSSAYAYWYFKQFFIFPKQGVQSNTEAFFIKVSKFFIDDNFLSFYIGGDTKKDHQNLRKICTYIENKCAVKIR